MGEAILPLGGLDDSVSIERQRKATTREMRNWTPEDAVTKRAVPAQRPGMIKHATAALVADTKVHTVLECVYDQPQTVFSNVAGGAVTSTWKSPTTNKTDCLGVIIDGFGNRWTLDGSNGIVMRNADGVVQLKISLPATEPGSVVRAFAVDDFGIVYAGVSAGADPAKAKVWAYERIEGKKTQLLWEMSTGFFVEEMKIDAAGLYLAENDTIGWRSRISLYGGYTLKAPTLLRQWSAPYPINGMDVSAIDGSVFTAHQPNDKRGLFPRSIGTSATSVDWTPRDDPNFASAVRAWHQARDIDGDDSMNAAYAAGDVIDTWYDKTDYGRNWYARTPDTGPTLLKDAVAGLDVLSFNGTSQSMISSPAVSLSQLDSALNKNVLPTHTRAQFVLIMAVRVAPSQTARCLIAQTKTNPTAGYDGERVVYMNATFNAGVTQAQGNVQVYEESNVAPVPSGRPSGGNNVPLPGCFDGDGLVLLTYICDGGYDDVGGGLGTRSLVRVNGRPVDRWKSIATFESLTPTSLAIDVYPNGTTTATRFEGSILEMIVLQDNFDFATGINGAPVQRKLIASEVTYPDVLWVGVGSDTTLERYEGYMANANGMAHKLPSGQWAGFQSSGVTAGDTVTIDAVVYTFANPIGAAANQVLQTANTFDTLRRLSDAINGTGLRGTDYSAATTPHPTFWSPGCVENGEVAGQPTCFIQRRDAAGTSAVVLAEAGATNNWLDGAVAPVVSRNGAGRNAGHYPHPFFLYKTAQSTGGPPRPGGVGTPSIPSGLTSIYGILAKWDPANGKVRNVLTTNGPGLTGNGFGGVGYGVRVLPSGHVISCGPRQGAVVGLGITADNLDVRKVIDLGAAWDTGTAAGALKCWVAAPGALQYAYPRMAVDKFGNAYLPFFGAASTKSLLVYKEVATSAATDDTLILTVDGLADDPRAYAVDVDRDYPDFPTAYADKRAETVCLATRVETATNFDVIYNLELVTKASSNVPQVVIARAAGCGASLYAISKGNAPTLISASAFDASARFVSWAQIFGKVFITDGTSTPKMWDPRNGTFGFMRARSGGKIPTRPALFEAYGNRLFAGPLGDDRHALMASAYGDVFGWDIDPQGEDPVPLAAWHSRFSKTTGDIPDNVTMLCAKQDDLLMVGGSQSMAMLRGDPLQGGRFDTVVKGLGAAFGRSGCFLPDGSFVWVTDQAELRRYTFQGEPELLSRPIQDRLSKAIDFSVCRPELSYNPLTACVHIRLFPHGVGNTLFTHFLFYMRTGAFVEVTYVDKDRQPTAMLMGRGDVDASRVMILGCRDGFTREESVTAYSDDGDRIDGSMLIGPLADPGSGMDYDMSGLEILMSNDTTGARFEVVATNNPSVLGDAIPGGELLCGRNTPSTRASGSWLGVRVLSSMRGDRAALERLNVSVRPGSRYQRLRR